MLGRCYRKSQKFRSRATIRYDHEPIPSRRVPAFYAIALVAAVIARTKNSDHELRSDTIRSRYHLAVSRFLRYYPRCRCYRENQKPRSRATIRYDHEAMPSRRHIVALHNYQTAESVQSPYTLPPGRTHFLQDVHTSSRTKPCMQVVHTSGRSPASRTKVFMQVVHTSSRAKPCITGLRPGGSVYDLELPPGESPSVWRR